MRQRIILSTLLPREYILLTVTHRFTVFMTFLASLCFLIHFLEARLYFDDVQFLLFAEFRRTSQKINQCANMDVRAPPRTLEMGHTKRTQRVPRGALRYFVGDFVIRAWLMSDDECEHHVKSWKLRLECDFGTLIGLHDQRNLEWPFKPVLGNNQSQSREYRLREWFLTYFAE